MSDVAHTDELSVQPDPSTIGGYPVPDVDAAPESLSGLPVQAVQPSLLEEPQEPLLKGQLRAEERFLPWLLQCPHPPYLLVETSLRLRLYLEYPYTPLAVPSLVDPLASPYPILLFLSIYTPFFPMAQHIVISPHSMPLYSLHIAYRTIQWCSREGELLPDTPIS